MKITFPSIKTGVFIGILLFYIYLIFNHFIIKREGYSGDDKIMETVNEKDILVDPSGNIIIDPSGNIIISKKPKTATDKTATKPEIKPATSDKTATADE
jgi:hypothetical protein